VATEFRTNSVRVFAFNYKAAAGHLGVSLRTIYRWFEWGFHPSNKMTKLPQTVVISHSKTLSIQHFCYHVFIAS